MAELVIGAFLSASFQVLLEKIASPYAAEFLFSKGNKEKISERLSKLKSTLDGLCDVRLEVENKRIKNPDVESWLEGLLDAVDDAEDFFGDIKYDALRPKKAESSKAEGKASELLSKLPFRSVDDERNTNLENILTRLEYFAKQIQTLGLEKNIVDARPSKAFLAKTSLPEEPEIEIYGREHDIDALMKLVKSDEVGSQKICVIPIFGMGGVGKTTLAQSLYNDERVKEMFEIKAWVSNYDKFDAEHVTKTILQQVNVGDVSNHMDLNSLQVNLMKKLMGKRFMIVLDNVWEDIHPWWTEVMKPFHNGAKGSKIIVTTRDENVADSIRTVDTYSLGELSSDQCWKVFEKYASSITRNIFIENPRLESMGREVVKKCNGLPLAAKVLGSLLRSTLKVERWEQVLKNNIWKLTDQRSTILPAALEVSYYYLPSHLKRCFAYCSIFPKGYEFQREEVVLLWMAANLVEQGDREMRMEDIGGEYFDDLVSRSFFQLKTKTHTSTSFFVMHELINDLARTVAGKYFCLLELDEASMFDEKTRHLGCVVQLLCSENKISSYKIEASHLRTFLSFGRIYGTRICDEVVHNLLLKLKWLKVLSFRYSRITKLSESIGALKHLRYLDLSYTDIMMLPKSVVQLYNLQTLKLEDCYGLQALPDDMHHLINLRHLIISGCGWLAKMPSQMRRLTNLQTLTNFVVGNNTRAAEVEELAELPNLQGELSIQRLENVVNISEAGKEVKLLDKKKLEKLSLEWSARYVGEIPEEGEGVLEMLSPHVTLKQIRILRYPGTHFPNWIGNDSLRNIVDVRLEDCSRCSKLPTFGHLPFLKNLHISGFDLVEEVGAEFYGNGDTKVPFSSLETLSISNMSSWKVWESPYGKLNSMPSGRLWGSSWKVWESVYGKLNSMPSWRLWGSSWKVWESAYGKLMLLWRFWGSPSLWRSDQTEPDAIPLGKLKTLEISNCPNLHLDLPESLPSLTKLLIITSSNGDYNYSFSFLDMDLYPNLKTLSIRDCRNFEGLSQSFKGRASLSSIDIYDCPNFINFPSGGLIAPKLSHLAFTSCNSLKALPEKMSSLSSLKTLEISGCPLQSLPKGGLPISLSKLEISYLQLLGMNWDWRTLPHLTCLSICGYQVLGIKSFPDEGLLPDTITSLKIKNFLDLKSLGRDGLRQLTSLQTLEISNCPKLETLSEDWFPASLTSLDTWNCPLLKRTYPNESGTYKIGGVSQVWLG